MLTEGTDSERLPTVSAFTREVPGLLRKNIENTDLQQTAFQVRLPLSYLSHDNWNPASRRLD